MKKPFLFLSVLMAGLLSLYAQAPDKMSYQAIIRDAENNILSNQSIAIQVSILEGLANGTAVYAETQSPTTNENGLISIEIGTGTAVSGMFSAINWAVGPFFIKTEIDPAGGTNYSIVITSQLLSVPYAKYAEKAGNGFSGDYYDLLNAPSVFLPKPCDGIQSFMVSKKGDTLRLSSSNFVIIPGISKANYADDACPKNLESPQLALEGMEEYEVNGTEYIRYKLDVTNFASYPDYLFLPAPELPACGSNSNSSRAWVDIYDNDDNKLYGFCALGSAAKLNDIWFAVKKGDPAPAGVYITITDRKCETTYSSNKIAISFDYEKFLGPWVNEDPETSGITKAFISEWDDSLFVHMWGKCHPTDCDWDSVSTLKSDAIDGVLEVTWNQSFAIRKQTLEVIPDGRLKTVTKTHFTDGSGRADYTKTEFFVRELIIAPPCPTSLPNPKLALEGVEDYQVSGNKFVRFKLNVTNFASYPDYLFDEAPDLPACGVNTNASRTWVDIYDQDDKRLYGFCALGQASDLNDIWFAVPFDQWPPKTVYIVITDRRCDKSYTSNKIEISWDYSQFLGHWVNENTKNPNITKANITEDPANLFIHMWGNCTPTDCDWDSVSTPKIDAIDGVLGVVWEPSFAIRHQTLEVTAEGKLKVVTKTHFTDDSGREDYTSTEYFIRKLPVDETCPKNLPAPKIVIDTINKGETKTTFYLDVTNYSSFPDELFEATMQLPACGLNTNSSRSWVDIYNQDGARLYGFCAFGQAADLNLIWFSVANASIPDSVYIEINDRLCDKVYKSNTIALPKEQPFKKFLGKWYNENKETSGITKVFITELTTDLNIEEWGKCHPTDCEWGSETTPKTDANDNVLMVKWVKSFVERKQTLELTDSGKLKVTTQSHFTDGSGRPDYTTTEYFVQ
ncbi:MAG: hypothetical protein HC896_04090 [Bacteroidales bacterium]|nr:hypothetical protein [Bacteroidales bacterium]